MEHYRGISFEGASTPIREGLEQVVLAELLSELTPMGWLNQWRIGQHGIAFMVRLFAYLLPTTAYGHSPAFVASFHWLDCLDCYAG